MTWKKCGFNLKSFPPFKKGKKNINGMIHKTDVFLKLAYYTL